jgi:hypothetical protein
VSEVVARGQHHLSLAEIFCRCFGTFVAALLAAIGAENLHVAWVMIGIGALFDVFRNFFAPDLVAGEKQVAESIAAATRDPIVASRYKAKLLKQAWIIYGIWVGYTIIFSLVEPIVSPHLMQAYLRFFEPLYKACAFVFTIAREHPRELMEHGYPYRALVVAHIYAFDWTMFALSLGSQIFSRAYYRAHPKTFWNEYQVLVRAERRLKVAFLILKGPALTLLFYLGASYFLKIDWTGTRTPMHAWPVQLTNAPFPMLTVLLVSAEFALAWMYQYLIIYRAGEVYRRGDESMLRPAITGMAMTRH